MEITRMKKSIASLALAGTMFGGAIVGASAAPVQTSSNGAGGLVAATVAALNNVNVTDNTVDVPIVQLNNSLNNLNALNNVLNNSPILDNNTILQGITVQNIDVAIANGSLNNNNLPILQNALQNANIDLTRVVGVAVLSGGDLLVFAR